MGTKKATPVKNELTNVIVENQNPVKMDSKVLNLKFYQTNGIEIDTTFELTNDSKNSILIGTALNELFTMYSNYNKAGIKLFKSSEPVLFLISNDSEVLLNVGKCKRTILDKLKFNKTAKSMKVFSKRVNLAVTEMTRNVKEVDYSEVEKAIDSIED